MKKLWSKMTPEFAEGRRQPDPGVGSDMVPPSVLSGQHSALWTNFGRTDVSATLKAPEKYGLACHYMWSAADGPRRLEGR